MAASQEFSRRLYAQAQSQSPDGAGPTSDSAPSDDEVADAEIVDDADEAKGA